MQIPFKAISHNLSLSFLLFNVHLKRWIFENHLRSVLWAMDENMENDNNTSEMAMSMQVVWPCILLLISSKFPFKSERQLFFWETFKITGSFQFLLYPRGVYCAPFNSFPWNAIETANCGCQWRIAWFSSPLWTGCRKTYKTQANQIYTLEFIFPHNRMYVNGVFSTIFQPKKSIFSTSAFEHFSSVYYFPCDIFPSHLAYHWLIFES